MSIGKSSEVQDAHINSPPAADDDNDILNESEGDDSVIKRPLKPQKRTSEKRGATRSKKHDANETDSDYSDSEKLSPDRIRSETQRVIKIGQSKPAYGSNAITTRRFTALTFLPLALYKQFTTVVHLIFLLFSILQCIPEVSISNQGPSSLIPLFFAIIVVVIKDLFEDLNRSSLDREENRVKVNLLKQDKPYSVARGILAPGDIILIKDGEQVPADCLLLYSSSVHQECCYIDTKNLDGQTMLKRKQIVLPFEKPADDNALEYLHNFINARVVYEIENPDLEVFKGILEFGDQKVALSVDNLLLRGSWLKSTDYVYGVVLFVGFANQA